MMENDMRPVLEATRKIMAYTGSLSKAGFLEDEKTFDAVVRNLEIIGEVVKKHPFGILITKAFLPPRGTVRG